VNPSKAALKIQGRFPDPGDYRVHVCDQCGKCADVCPEEAIHLEDGVYVIHRDECSGCLICMDECPYGVLFEHSSEEAPIKCTLCGECVTACPREALVLA
jgi:ferredoxin